jgi:hypothetical protein
VNSWRQMFWKLLPFGRWLMIWSKQSSWPSRSLLEKQQVELDIIDIMEKNLLCTSM